MLLSPAASHRSAQAQLPEWSDAFSLADDVRLDEVDRASLAHLENVRTLVSGEQYEEAIARLRQISETQGDKLIRIAPDRYVSVREYCHARIAAFPDEALEIYRRIVDPLAEPLYQRGIQERDEAALSAVVDTMFCSVWGDDALLALGEIALEKGDPAAARGYWTMLFEIPPPAIPGEFFEAARGEIKSGDELLKTLEAYYERQEARELDGRKSAWYVARKQATSTVDDRSLAQLVAFWKERGLPAPRLAYPRSEVPLADVRARIILADLLERSTDRAEEALKRFALLHPGARGRMAGKEVDYAAHLGQLLAAAKDWPEAPANDDWPTFAGDAIRSKTLDRPSLAEPRLGPPAWTVALPPVDLPGERSDDRLFRERRVGENAAALLGYYPVVVGSKLFVATDAAVLALDARTGKPAWPSGEPNDPGVVFEDLRHARRQPAADSRGAPRSTLSVHGDLLVARMGSPITAQPRADDNPRRAPIERSRIIVLDVSSRGQGKSKAMLVAPANWAFEGTPLLGGDLLYTAMRRSDVQPETHAACYDLSTVPPTLRWRRFVAAAETPGSGSLLEYTHNLLTLSGDSIYFNTNLGVVAAIDASDGRIRWAYRYPRARLGNLSEMLDTPHFYRDLNPCLYDRGIVYAAPFDTPAVMALDAATGRLLWTTDAAADAIWLLGIRDGQLIASGDRLYALDAQSGRLLYHWPDGAKAEPRGIGRGMILGRYVYWPAREQIHVFDMAASAKAGAARMPIDPVSLVARGATGGNLLFASGRWIVAGSDGLTALEVDP